MNTILKHGITFFRFFANERWGLQPNYKGEDIDFGTILDPENILQNLDSTSDTRLFLWHRNHGYVCPKTTGNNTTIGHAIANHLTNDYESTDRNLMLEITHIGIYIKNKNGQFFDVYKFNKYWHANWTKKNPLV